MNRKLILALGLAFLVFLLTGSSTRAGRDADTNYPRDLTLYFLKAGSPYNQPLDFAIECYDFSSHAMIFPSPGELVFTYTGYCENYGCSFVHEIYPEFYGYCSMRVSTMGQTYRIEGYSNFPFGACAEHSLDTCTLALELTSSSRHESITTNPVSFTPTTNLFFALAWLLTIVLETTVLILLARFFFRVPARMTTILGAGLLASSLTLPYLWFVLPVSIYAGELIVVLVEAILYRWVLKMKAWQVLLISLAANLVSFAAGLLIF